MNRLAVLAGALLLPFVFTVSADAQATRTWVSGVGDDANPCSRTAPCKSFAGSISKTASGGEINCLDSAGYGPVTITKPIVISCRVGTAGIAATGTNGIIINAPGATVVLDGLDLQGYGTGLSGINFINGSVLHVKHTIIRGFNSDAAGFGINFTPSGAAELYVSDSFITDNGTGSTGGGIMIRPTAGGSYIGTITRTQLENNAAMGFRVNTSGITGGWVNFAITDTVASGAMNGISLIGASSTPIRVMLDHDTIEGNTSSGVIVNGNSAVAILSNSTITGNDTGVKISSGGVINTYADNRIYANITADGTPTLPALTKN